MSYETDAPRAIAIQTDDNTWEPAFWSTEIGEYVIEPGFARSTEAEVLAEIAEDLGESNVIYQAGYAYACGYFD